MDIHAISIVNIVRAIIDRLQNNRIRAKNLSKIIERAA